MEQILNGSLDEIIDALVTADQAEKLRAQGDIVVDTKIFRSQDIPEVAEALRARRDCRRPTETFTAFAASDS
jgi:hypothetical protein